MARVTGKSAVQAYMGALPRQLTSVLRSAVRAGGQIIKTEAQLRSESAEVAENVTIQSRANDGRVSVLITVAKGWWYSVGVWLEYGTDPHFISVDDSQRQGFNVRRINTKLKAGTLVINGQHVGATVFHPGARPYPFLRPALDAKEGEAIAAAQSYINARIRPGRLTGRTEGGDE